MKGPALALTLAVLGGVAFGQTGPSAEYDRAFSDLWHRLAGVREVSKDVGLVIIDRPTLNAHREEPLVTWGPYFARALDVLREVGAAGVALDVHFDTSLEEWLVRARIDGGTVSRTWDAPLREALNAGGVIVAAAIEEEGLQLPVMDLMLSLPGRGDDVGLVNLVPDEDGVVRSFVARIDLGEETMPTLGALAAERAGSTDPRLTTQDLHPIPWVGPPGAVFTVSFERLLRDDAASLPDVRALAGRVVVIGSDATQDTHLTPYGMMRGPEIQANVVHALVAGAEAPSSSRALDLLLLLFVAGLGVLAGLRMQPGWAISTYVGLFALVPFLALGAFRGGVLLSVAPAHAALVIAAVGSLGARVGGERRLRAQLADLFGRYVSDDVVERLVAEGRVPDLGGEMSHVTVMFMDIRNFTTISEKRSPQEVIGFLNDFFGLAVEPILENGGTVDKYLGDGLMAIFGSPAPWPDHARRAVKAAIEMDRIARQFVGVPDFAIGIGIHTGVAVTGNVGSRRRMEFTAIGDTVNTAARIESVTKAMGIKVGVSQAVVDEVGPGLRLGKHEELAVKGRAELVHVYELLGLEEDSQS